MRFVLAVLLAAAVLATSTVRADEREAEALATSAMTLLSAKPEKARELFFKALAHDQNCPVALYELGKIFEAEGNQAAAADFLGRAVIELGKKERNNPEYSPKRADAKARLQRVNPAASQYNYLMEEYTLDLAKIAKKSPDTLTVQETQSRISSLQLDKIVAPEKLQSLQAVVAQGSKSSSSGSSSSSGGVALAPEVERALKNAGWTKITGSWKKISEGVYEVTNGKLETEKIDGGIRLFVHKGGSGSVSVLVRNNPNREVTAGGFVSSSKDKKETAGDDAGSSTHSTTSGFRSFGWDGPSGYGVIFKGQDCKVYCPSGGFTNNVYYPDLHHTATIPSAYTKSQVTVTIQDSAFSVIVNEKKEVNTNYKIPKEGNFVLSVSGTMVIEAPMAAGQ